jgi:cyanophycinase
MTGSLALVGSGEYLPAMAELEKELIEKGIDSGKSSLFLQIPTAAGQESTSRLQYWQDLGRAQAERIGVQSRFLPIFDRQAAFNPEFVETIKSAALVYISGGDPHYLADSLVGTPVGDAIIENWRSGGSLAGCSAGAMVLSNRVPHFRFSRSEARAGFSIIPKIRVIPHFDKFFKWIPETSAKMLMKSDEGEILVGIDEMTALVRNSGEQDWQVFGSSKVHILQGAPPRQLAHGERIELDFSI